MRDILPEYDKEMLMHDIGLTEEEAEAELYYIQQCYQQQSHREYIYFCTLYCGCYHSKGLFINQYTTIMKYKQNLRVKGDKVWSYTTHVATICGNKLIVHGWWSVTTSKHINHVADILGLTKVDDEKLDALHVA